MTFRIYFYLYLITIPIFIVVDLIWINLFVQGFYQSQVGALLGETKVMPIILFYLLFTAGSILFAVRPALEQYGGSYAVLHGGLLGLLAYSTFGLTNLAFIEAWPAVVTASDIVWGTILGGSVSGLSYLIGHKLWL